MSFLRYIKCKDAMMIMRTIAMNELIQHLKKVAADDFRDFFYPFVAVYRAFKREVHRPIR